MELQSKLHCLAVPMPFQPRERICRLLLSFASRTVHNFTDITVDKKNITSESNIPFGRIAVFFLNFVFFSLLHLPLLISFIHFMR